MSTGMGRSLRLLVPLWHHLNPHRRRQYVLLLVLMVVTSIAEMAGVGSVFPFLAVLTSPAHVFHYPAIQPMIHALGISRASELILPMTVTFAIAVLAAGIMRLLMLWASTRLSFATGADLSVEIYRRTLYQPYAVHVARNSSEIINGISGKVGQVIQLAIMPVLTLISSSMMFVAILGVLLSVHPSIALATLAGFGSIYAIVIRLTHKRLSVNSERIARESTQVIKALQEGLGGIRDVLINGAQPVYCQTYRAADLPLRHAQGGNIFIGSSPRYAMESLGMVLIAALAYGLSQQADGVAKAIPMLGFMALAAQRLLPVLQQAYAAWSSIHGGAASLQDALALLEQPLPAYAGQPPAEPIAFDESIVLRRLDFSYGPGLPPVLEDLSLTIRKGSRVGFIGKTGSGKSTLLDIVMGLLQPAAGVLEIDGVAISEKNVRGWQAHIAHVPQSIFLTDGSIEANIAFGVPEEEIDVERVRRVARQAEIADVIEGLPDRYRTIVGERGIRLSGGQRQRIGIARALYRKADVIVFDEATSALDGETEQAVMQAIEGLGEDLTILIIAHRLSTLKNCAQIVELGDRGIRRVGSYREMVNVDSVAEQKGDVNA